MALCSALRDPLELKKRLTYNRARLSPSRILTNRSRGRPHGIAGSEFNCEYGVLSEKHR